MSKPLQPKDVKPKEEGAGANKPLNNLNTNMMIVINTIVTIIILALFMVIMYSMFETMMSKKIAALYTPEQELEAVEAPENEKGVMLDLGDFILNLADSQSRRYLKVNVAMELSKTSEEVEMIEEAAHSEGGGGGHGHGAEPVDPMEEIIKEIEQFKPAIRDAIITVMSNKTSDELSTTTGKELSKEEIKEMVDSVFDGQRRVLRVSFGQFIIQ